MTRMFLYLLLAAALVAGVVFLLKNQGTGLGTTTLFPTTASAGTTIAPLGGGGGLSTIVTIVLAVVGFVLVVLGFVAFQNRDKIMEKYDFHVLEGALEKVREEDLNNVRNDMVDLQDHWRGEKELDLVKIIAKERYLGQKLGSTAFDAFERTIDRDHKNNTPRRFRKANE